MITKRGQQYKKLRIICFKYVEIITERNEELKKIKIAVKYKTRLDDKKVKNSKLEMELKNLKNVIKNNKSKTDQ